MGNFNQKVWKLLGRIPWGKVTPYKELAAAVGNPNAARAVGNACNTNPFAPEVPCHRVVSSDGSIGGYAHGTEKKIRLLGKEGIKVRQGKIVDFDSKLYSFRLSRRNK